MEVLLNPFEDIVKMGEWWVENVGRYVGFNECVSEWLGV